ncbi:MAG: LptF/LptG family permease, partial [Cyanobacteria bacterium]|nr:LptF/LptG family permease [Cyanobacteriota bacterium]
MIKTLDRYIFTQLLDYFMLGMVIFTLIGFFSDSFLDFIQDIQKFGISFTTALTMMGLQLPKIVALVMPASSFLAVLMVYSGLNAAFEITAIRMNGISLGRLVLPALTLGLMASVFAYLLGDYAVPYCNQQTEALKNQAIEKGTLPVGRESFTFKDYDDSHQLRKMIYIGKYSGRKLQDTTIIDLSKPSMMQVIQSKSGEWYPDHWVFENANAYTVSKTSETLFFNHLGEFSIKNLID